MGGHGAFSKAMKHPDKFRLAMGILPPLNMLWGSCRGSYYEQLRSRTAGASARGRPSPAWWSGKFFGGLVIVREGQLIHPLYRRNNPLTSELIKRDNPFDLLDSRDVQPGQFQFFIAYAGKDEFNIDAQVESFLFRAHAEGHPRHRPLPARRAAQHQNGPPIPPRHHPVAGREARPVPP